MQLAWPRILSFAPHPLLRPASSPWPRVPSLAPHPLTWPRILSLGPVSSPRPCIPLFRIRLTLTHPLLYPLPPLHPLPYLLLKPEPRRLIKRNRPNLIRQIIHDHAGGILRWTGLDERLANAVLDGLYKLLAETLVMPDHPLRGRIIEGLDQLADDLLHSPQMQARVQRAPYSRRGTRAGQAQLFRPSCRTGRERAGTCRAVWPSPP